jgi:hypothetical protein
MRRARGSICGASGPICRARPDPAPRMGASTRRNGAKCRFLTFTLHFSCGSRPHLLEYAHRKRGPTMRIRPIRPAPIPKLPLLRAHAFLQNEAKRLPQPANLARVCRASLSRARRAGAIRTHRATKTHTAPHFQRAGAKRTQNSPPVPIRCDQMQPDATCARNAISRPPILTDQPTRIALRRYEFRRRPPRLEPPHPAGVR